MRRLRAFPGDPPGLPKRLHWIENRRVACPRHGRPGPGTPERAPYTRPLSSENPRLDLEESRHGTCAGSPRKLGRQTDSDWVIPPEGHRAAYGALSAVLYSPTGPGAGHRPG